MICGLRLRLLLWMNEEKQEKRTRGTGLGLFVAYMSFLAGGAGVTGMPNELDCLQHESSQHPDGLSAIHSYWYDNLKTETTKEAFQNQAYALHGRAAHSPRSDDLLTQCHRGSCGSWPRECPHQYCFS